MINNKIQQQHISKLAYVYLRQSTIKQVKFNQESTERQYALQDKAHQLGWLKNDIRVLDGDLGISGSQSHNREDFKTLVADVSMGKVGAVFALEASRLSRSCTDWHRLLELCALTGTLIIDEDGSYNPADFNDQLLLGLKGTMSQAELHFIRARLQGGKINKAKKGELRFPLPAGFCYDNDIIKMDADEQVRSSIQLLFKVFKEKGSAYGVVNYFGKNNLKFPNKTYGGIWKGKLVWVELTHSRVLNVLKNPSYAGVYVYGRHKYSKTLSDTGELKVRSVCKSIDESDIVIKDHHEAYITWKEYLINTEKLKNNMTTGNILPAAAREGLALLQGLLICGGCGHRLGTRYQSKGIHPTYECRKRGRYCNKSCFAVRSESLDAAISQKILEAIKPVQIEIAIKAFEELEQRSTALDNQWHMKIERADYDAQLAQCRYEEVDPSNRLVASTLEKRWNEALIKLDEIKAEYSDYQSKNALSATAEQKNKIMSLAKDLPLLWNASSTSSKDRKQILRLLIKDITVNKVAAEHKAILYIRWQGGHNEEIKVSIPRKIHEQWKHSPELIEQVRILAETMSDKEIVDKYNQEGLKTNKGNAFTLKSVNWIRSKYKIPTSKGKRTNELSITEAAAKFNVSHFVIRYWIETGLITARRPGLRIFVSFDAKKEEELKLMVGRSTKIATVRSKPLKQPERGVL